MSKEISFYEKDVVDLETNFYRYMDTLLTNKSSNKGECFVLLIIFYTQLISGYFCEQVKLLKEEKVPDNYLMLIQTITRIRDLFKGSYSTYKIIIYLMFILYSIMTGLFILRVKNLGKRVYYSYCEVIINYFLKTFYFILFQPTLDFCLSLLCFSNHNPNFNDPSVTCSLSNEIPLTIIMILVLIYSIVLQIFLSLYYNESFMLSNNPLSRISTKYELYMTINMIFYSILLTYTYNLGPLIFLLYNLIISLILLKFYIENHPYYDQTTSFLILFFHLLYAWAAIFGLLFFFIKCVQLSITFITIGLCVAYMAYNLHYKMNEEITLNLPFIKLRNKQSILIYIKNLLSKMNTLESNQEDKAEIIGIVHLHKIECPLVECPSKIEKKKFYLPITDEWSKPEMLEFNDRVYLNNFIIFIYDFFISQNIISSDILMNLSLYYLQIIGNHCQAMYFCQRAGNEKLSLEEKFMHFRTSELISKTLVKTFKPSNEIAVSLEEVNTSMYFKYQDLFEKFFCEISSDISISTEFWKLFVTDDYRRRKLDFNRIFTLTDKIRNTKQKIEQIWSELFETFNGCNELFSLYENYTEYINDDDLLIRELLKIKNKYLAMRDTFNYYEVMFDNNTGVIIASGDRGKEGMIEKVSENLTKIFQFTDEELKGMNVGFLMPRMFEKDHRRFMQRAINVGEKRVIDKSLRTFAKDKNNNLLVLNIMIKLFPILSESTFFCALITKEDLNDVILLDQEYNIQGMTSKLYDKFKVNRNIFQDCDVAFWMICKEFIQHYQTFMANNPLIKGNYNKKSNDDNSNSLYTSTKSAIKTLGVSNIDNNPQASNINNINQNNNINNNTELNFEIDENADLQWEIAIPPIFKMYIAEENKNSTYFTSMGIGFQKNDDCENNSDLPMDNSREEDNDYADENNKMLPSSNPDDSSANKSLTQSYGGQDHDKEFQNYVGRYRTLFNNGNEINLKELMNMLNTLNEGNEPVNKFVISFKQIRYGEGKLGYIVRCIDNKNEGDLSSDEKMSQKSEEEDANKKLEKKEETNEKDKEEVFDRRKYLKDLKLEEITEDEISSFKETINNFQKLTFEDEKINATVESFHKEICDLSRVLGNKVRQATMDENGSQSSSASQVTNSITKKSRVQEIKSNIMINVKNFYTLRLIKLLFVLIMIISVVFTIFYVFEFDSFLNKTKIIDNLHSIIMFRLFNYITIISLVNSLKGISEYINKGYFERFSIYTSIDNYSNNNTNYTNYTADYYIYANTQRNIISLLYMDLIDFSNIIELNYTKEIKKKNNAEFIWEKVNEGFTFSETEKNEIGIIMSISQTLSYVNRLINSSIEFPKNYKGDPELERKVNYTLKKIIESSYLNDLPNMIILTDKISKICSDENNRNSSITNLVIIIYMVICIICSILYALLLFLTNKNMEDGLKVVGRIDPIFINETLENIDHFNKQCLNEFRQKKDKDNLNNAKNKTNNNITDTNVSTVSGKSNIENNNENEDNDEEEIGFSDNNAHKKLNVLSYSYFQSLILLFIFGVFIIPVFIESKSFVNNSNNFLLTKEYFFDYFNKNALDVLNMKILISNSNIQNDDYLDFNIDKTKDKQIIVKQINKYNELYQFYTKKYISTVCSVLYNQNEDKYTQCLNDQKLTEYSSIEDLLNLLQEYIYNIRKDYSLQKDLNNSFNGYLEYSNENFGMLEYLHNNYFIHIPNKLHFIFSKSIGDFIKNKKDSITKILIFLSICTCLFSLYIIFIYINVLINLLSISRCIFKIIPTKVINKTKELEEWIDDTY